MEKTHTILVADDSVTIQKVLELTFMDEPYEVISVGDGVRAREEIAKYKPSIVLADVHMPGQNGYEVCRQTKELWPNTPVLLLVGVFEPFDEIKYRACGADGVIEKPFDSQDALRMVETLILGGHLVKPLLFSSRRIVHGPVTKEEVAHPGRDAGLKVFLCHASQDRPIVHELHRKLRISRFLPWMDGEDILPGQDWNLAIRRALRESDAVVVCLSKAALTKAGYVQREIAFALDLLAEQPEGSIFLIPLKLEECEIPERLKHLQFARFYDDKGFGRLVAALEERSREPSVAIAGSLARTPSPPLGPLAVHDNSELRASDCMMWQSRVTGSLSGLVVRAGHPMITNRTREAWSELKERIHSAQRTRTALA